LKTITVRSAVAAILAGLTFSAAAIAEHARAINVPAGDLVAALESLAKQADIELVYQAEQLRGGRTGGISGIYEPKEAVQLLLEGSQFSIRIDEETGVMLIVPARSTESSPASASDGVSTAESPSSMRNASASKGLWSRLRVARTDTSAETAAGRGAGNTRDGDEPTKEIELEEIVITGTHIRGTQSLTAPAIVIDRTEIQRSGFSTVQDLMESLPQNFSGMSPDGRLANEGGSALAKLNNDRVSSVDLRGLGAQSTLTLVNGHRRAGTVSGRVVDVSAIPLSMIDRVEVVTDGRSAIYGSDAVAGVVNFVLRRDFSGAETQASYGGSADGGERLQLSHSAGYNGDRGGIVAGYDYSRDWILDLADVGLLSRTFPDNAGVLERNTNVQADTWRHAGFASGRYTFGERAEFYGDALYTNRKFRDYSVLTYRGAPEDSFSSTDNEGAQYSVSAGVRLDLSGSWRADLSGAYSKADVYQDQVGRNSYSSGGEDYSQTRSEDADLLGASLILDGQVSLLPGVSSHVALGVEVRREEFDQETHTSFNGFSIAPSTASNDRMVRSAFLEALLRMPTTQPLEVSLAARYDDFSDFGGTFNPQFGFAWQVLPSTVLKATYSSAFRAPALVELGSNTYTLLSYIPDPAGGADVPLMVVSGDNANLGPEKAKAWSVGLEFSPQAAQWLTGSLSYFHVDYRDRVELAAHPSDYALLIERQSRYPGLLTLAPTAEQALEYYELGARNGGFFNVTGVSFDPAAQSILSTFPNVVLFDGRYNNIAADEIRGIDGRVDARTEVAGGELTLGLNATYTFEQKRRVTPSSPSFSVIDEVGKPVALRARANAGWSKGAFGGYVHLNYTDSYSNPFSSLESKMDSYLTVDATLRVDGSKLVAAEWLSGVSASLSVANLLDEKPPFFDGGFTGILYDSANASPFGRYYSLRLTKTW
jgi:iron complex outermembrane receptor protein